MLVNILIYKRKMQLLSHNQEELFYIINPSLFAYSITTLLSSSLSQEAINLKVAHCRSKALMPIKVMSVKQNINYLSLQTLMIRLINLHHQIYQHIIHALIIIIVYVHKM